MLIEFRDVSFNYKNRCLETNALKNVSLKIDAGQFVSILGANGSGKSTFAKLLNALLIPTQGSVLINGMDTAQAENISQIRQTVGLVFQNPDDSIIGETVEDDVAFAPENLGLSYDEIENRIKNALELTKLTKNRFDKTTNLSGGQKQKLALASVLSMNTKCIVIDEATSMSDWRDKTELLENLHELKNKQNITVIQITQNPEECVNSDFVFVFDAGKLMEGGTPKEIFAEPERLYKLGLGVPPIVAFSQRLKKIPKFANLPSEILTKSELIKQMKICDTQFCDTQQTAKGTQTTNVTQATETSQKTKCSPDAQTNEKPC